MKTRFRLLPKGIEDAVFKPIPEGWLFTTQSPWLFAPRRTYIVDDQRKVALAERVRLARHLRLAAMLATFPIWVALIIHFPRLLSQSPISWAAFGAATLALSLGFALIDYFSVRSLLRDCPRTKQRIRNIDICKTQSRSLSVRALVLFTACEFAGAIAMSATFYADRNLLSAFGAGILFAFTGLFGCMLIYKLRGRTAADAAR